MLDREGALSGDGSNAVHTIAEIQLPQAAHYNSICTVAELSVLEVVGLRVAFSWDW